MMRILLVIALFCFGCDSKTSHSSAGQSGSENLVSRIESAYDLLYEGKADSALTIANKVISIDTSISKAYYVRGMSYMGKKEYAKASDDLNKAIKLDYEEKEKLFYNLGLSYYHQEEFLKCVVANDVAIEVNPEDGGAYYNRAVCKMHMGLRNEACADFEKAQELGVDMKEEKKINRYCSDEINVL